MKCSTFSHGITCVQHFCFFVVARKWFQTISKLCLSFRKKTNRNLFPIVFVVVSFHSVLLLFYSLASKSLNPVLNCFCFDEAHFEHVVHKIFKDLIFASSAHTKRKKNRETLKHNWEQKICFGRFHLSQKWIWIPNRQHCMVILIQVEDRAVFGYFEFTK